MTGTKSGAVSAGAKLVWRRQRVFWWVYAINFLLAVTGAATLRARAGAILDHSLAANRLVHGFDIAIFAALADRPSAPLAAAAPGSVLSTLVFFIFMLFLAGGILEVYRRDETLRTGEFFGACGRFFWRFVRLLIFMVIVFIPIFVLAHFVTSWSGKLASNAPQPLLGFGVEVAGLLLVAFLMMAVRLWFDLAQVLAVAEDQRLMRRTVLQAFKITFGNFGSLFWIYLRLCLLGAAGLALALWIWVRLVRPEAVGSSFLLGQAVILLWIAIRLWLRASETRWYQDAFPQAPEPAPAPSPEAAPFDLSSLSPPPASGEPFLNS
jgi:hypothetical protein